MLADDTYNMVLNLVLPFGNISNYILCISDFKISKISDFRFSDLLDCRLEQTLNCLV